MTETWAKSTTAGPVASYPWVRSHTERMLSEVPSQKLILGYHSICAYGMIQMVMLKVKHWL